MPDRWFVDTSAWFAFANRRDRDHTRVRPLLRDPGRRLVTSSYVFDETITICRSRLGHAAALAAGRVLRAAPTVDLVHVTPDDERAAWELFSARADQECSFTDCTSFVMMRRLSLRVAVALDDDFLTEGFELRPTPED